MKRTSCTPAALMLLALMVVAHVAPLHAMATSTSSGSRKLLDEGGDDKAKNRNNLIKFLVVGNLGAATQTLKQAAPADSANAALYSSNNGKAKYNSARAFNLLARADRGRAGAVWAQLLAQSRRQGKVYQAADIFKTALVEAKKNNDLPAVANSMAQGIASGGYDSRTVAATAMTSAIAGGPDQQQALAAATASVICSGQGSLATAWSSAFSIALTKDSRGCLVLNQAQALAVAQCQGGFFGKPGTTSATISNSATSTLLGFCGLLNRFPGFTFGSTQGSANTNNFLPGGSASSSVANIAATGGSKSIEELLAQFRNNSGK